MEKIDQLREEYGKFYRELLKQGSLPMRDTDKGFWGTTKIDAAYEFFKRIELGKFKNFLDLGSGDGCVVLVASLFTKATGAEYDKELVEKSLEIRQKTGLKATFIQGDYMRLNFSDYDFIFINPDTAFHRGLDQKLAKELTGVIYVYGIVHRPNLLKRGRTFWLEQMPIVEYKKK